MAIPSAAATFLGHSAAALQLLADASLKVTLIMTAACLLALLSRSASANIRRLVWMVALIGGAAVPVVTALVPGWHVPLLPARERTVDESTSEGPARDSGRSLHGPAAMGADPLQAALVAPETAASHPAHQGAFRAAGTAGWTAWALLVWLAGAALACGHQLGGLLQLRRWSRQAEPVRSGRWRRLLAEACAATRPGRKVRLVVSPQVPVPMTWGLLRPVVLLPAASAGWSDERARIVLQHELLHIRRGDWLLLCAARSACTLYWFHPLAWFALRRLVSEQELACDDAVLGLGTTPSTYATHLLEIARGLRATRPAIALEMARRSNMEGRLMALLDPERTRRFSLAALPLVILMFSLVPAIAAIHPWVGPQPVLTFVAAAPTAGQGATEDLRDLIREMREAEAELKPYTDRLRAIEAEMGPVHEHLREIEKDLQQEKEAFRQQQAELQPYHERLAEAERALLPYQEKLEAIARQMEPIKEELVAAQERSAPSLQELERLRQSMEPFIEQMEEVHREMERHMEDIEREHHALGEHQHHLSAVHQERLEQVAAEMEPYHERMEAVHHEMEQHHQRLDEVHHRFQRALGLELERVLRAELEHAVTNDAPFTRAAEAIIHHASITITDDDRLEIDSAPRTIVRALRRALDGSRAPGITDGELEDAYQRAAEAVLAIGESL